MAATTSWISSPACSPTMCPPRISFVLASATILTRPHRSPSIRARSSCSKLAVPVATSWPRSRASSSVRPTLATSGSEYVTRGATR